MPRQAPGYKQQSRKLFRQTKLELDSMIEQYLNPSSNLVELGQQLVNRCTQLFYTFVGFAHKQHAFRTQVDNYEAQLKQLRTEVQAALKADHPPSTRLRAVAKILVSQYPFAVGDYVQVTNTLHFAQRDDYKFEKWAGNFVCLATANKTTPQYILDHCPSGMDCLGYRNSAGPEGIQRCRGSISSSSGVCGRAYHDSTA